jgi:hypothetical protein
MDFCFRRDGNIRIDTHRDNTIMQYNIAKLGFTYCGIIYLASAGAPVPVGRLPQQERLAYQKILRMTEKQKQEGNDACKIKDSQDLFFCGGFP